VTSGPRFAWTHLGLVVLGGTVGTAARAGLLLIDAAPWPFVAVPVINVVGAMLLGIVIGRISRGGETASGRAVRHFLGTGVLGGFTTYSTFALLSVHGTPVWLTVATAVGGVAASLLGLRLGGLGRVVER
jgi:CrcB protein